MVLHEGCLKLNVDGAIFSEARVVGLGAILCNDRGQVVVAFLEFVWGSFDMCVVECWLFYMHLKSCWFGI